MKTVAASTNHGCIVHGFADRTGELVKLDPNAKGGADTSHLCHCHPQAANEAPPPYSPNASQAQSKQQALRPVAHTGHSAAWSGLAGLLLVTASAALVALCTIVTSALSFPFLAAALVLAGFLLCAGFFTMLKSF